MAENNVTQLSSAKKQKPTEEFPRRPGESVESWEKRFVQSLSDTDLKKLFASRAKAFKDISAQITIMRNEIVKRGLE